MATPAQKAALEKKALAADSKSEGMRSLLDAGYTVKEVKEVFGTAYGFTYGVATRWAAATGNVIPVAAREPRAAKAAGSTKAKAPAAKASAKAPAETRSKAAIASAARRQRARDAKATAAASKGKAKVKA